MSWLSAGVVWYAAHSDKVNPVVAGLGGAALVWQLSAQPGPRPIGITSRRGPTSSGGWPRVSAVALLRAGGPGY